MTTNGTMEQAKEKALDISAAVRERMSEGGESLKAYTIEQPARALGIALGLGGTHRMVDQTALRPTQANGRTNHIDSPIADGVIGNLAELGSNIAGLAELQAQLAIADIKESAQKAALPIVMIVGGLVLLVSALPVALIGLSELLFDLLHLPHRGLAYLIVAGVVVVLSAVLILIGAPRITRSFAILIRSKEELARNVAWIKTVLANSGRRPTQRRG